MEKYLSVYRRSLENPQEFWAEAADKITWFKRWDKVLDDTNKPFYRWFTGGELNTCYNTLDRHVLAGRENQIALIYDSPVTKQIKTFTYKELLEKVSVFAGALKREGIQKGDRIVLYMPMIPEAVVAILACARLGAIHSVVFGGFAPNELAVRIDDATPKLVISASGAIEVTRLIHYKPMLEKALSIARHKPQRCVIFQRPEVKADLNPEMDIDWNDFISGANPVDCIPVSATDPLYILYTSGTTGLPKGVMRDNGGHAVALRWSLDNIYDTHEGEVYWAASDIGWVVGHSYIIYGPLLTGCTTILYEGKSVGTPDPGAFWRVISQHNVKTLFTAPTAFRAIKREDPTGSYLSKYDMSNFRYLFLAGERTDPDTYHWASNLLKVPVIDHWWQTETGWPITANCLGIERLEVKPGSSTVPVPGYDVRVVDRDGTELEGKKEGYIVIKLPLPPGTLPTLWNNDQRFKTSYLDKFRGYYFTSDGGYKDQDGYVFIMGRVDDVINVAGHRLSTGEMEEIISKHPDVAECAVIGVHDSLKGQLPVGLVVLKSNVVRNEEEIVQELVKMIREELGPIACFKKACVVSRLPKTRSGKILRGTMRRIADGAEIIIPPTIDDPATLKEIEEALRKIGYARQDSEFFVGCMRIDE
ncbi:MAG: propionyl-CoA synthetase [Thermodesulfovibrionales bacterium]|nr:propionyl-CoA synthetase [Thermodesulfovibrionales bacterium]